jgi:hypothetical protein
MTARRGDGVESPTRWTVAIGRHEVLIEKLERLRWRVSIDGNRFATFCSESRARAAGRQEARRLDYPSDPASVAPGPRKPGPSVA